MKLKRIFTLTLVMLPLMISGCASEKSSRQSNYKPNYQPNQRSVKPLPIEAKYQKPRTLNHFNDYVQFLKRKALAAGVSSGTLNAQHFIHYNARAVELDRQQAAVRRDPTMPPPPSNPNGVTHYLNKVLTQTKVNLATEHWYDYQIPLHRASQKYGVPKEYILALWGMESSFGRYQGDFDVLSVLATLAFEGRREKLFTQEFVNAMKMLDQRVIKRAELKGSWAGAMGQTQFMPTAYLTYAADGDNDGKKDIWQSEADAFASIASYLSRVGWDKQLPWGVEVKLSDPIDLSFSGLEKKKGKRWTEWQSWGVYLASPNAQEMAKLAQMRHTELWLIRPDKEAGRAFLVTKNFHTLMDWNRSNNFGISIGKFADRILVSVGQ